jgi:hypothetical protein
MSNDDHRHDRIQVLDENQVQDRPASLTNHPTWWREARACAMDPLYRFGLLRRFSLLGLGLGTVGCAETMWLSSARGNPTAASAEQREDEEASRDLERPWYFTGSVSVDARGSGRWLSMLPYLESHLAPAQDELWPYYRPTLFQTLAPGQDTGLRSVITPIYTVEMCRAYERGRGLLSILARRGPPLDTAVIIDAPGPEAVAVGTALTAAFDPVFMFDNWPHKRGVVPSHLTLAAALYFAPLLDDLKAAPSAHRPPVFILDSNRLAPYSESADDFDNRYTIEVPEAEDFRQLGIKHLLYVTGRVQQTELDDLNDGFLALANHGVDIRLFALDDFRRASGEQGCEAVREDPYLFGGDEETDRDFWDWYAPASDPTLSLPVWIGSRAHYQPTNRPSVFGRPIPEPGSRPRPGRGPRTPWPSSLPSSLPSWDPSHPNGALPPRFGGGGRNGSFGRWHTSFTS